MLASRRAFLSAFASCVVPAVAEGRAEASEQRDASGFAVHDLTFDRANRAMQRARVYVPHDLTPDQKWPVAILLHGYAQALAEERALSAWGSEYDALGAYRSLAHGEVRETAALGSTRAEEIDQGLQAAPFRGMVLVTPVTPIPYFQRNLGLALTEYSDWMQQALLPRVAEVAPISTTPEAVGLAGVSMGGLVALELMWRFPERFAAYCGIQIAIKRSQAEAYAWLLRRAFDRLRPTDVRSIRIVTSTRDTYRSSNEAFYQALRRNRIEASLELRDGGHTSRWMRQAGSLESLFWLDRTLHAPDSPPPPPVRGEAEAVAEDAPSGSTTAPGAAHK